MKKASILAIFLTTCIDTLSWAIVFPIFAPFFLNPAGDLFAAETSIETRTTALGFFLTAFSLGQFFGAPLIGEYADSRGRKKALLITVFMTCLGLALTAWSVQAESLLFLFAGRLITGFFAANMTICLICIADLSEDASEKIKRFGQLSVIVGLSFVLGAFIGGKLSDNTVSSYFSPQLPLWLATGLTVINFLCILFGFQESGAPEEKQQFSLLSAVKNIQQALKTKKIKSIYSLYFLFLFAWTILFQFIPILMVRNFNFTNSNIGDLALFMGICWAIGSSYLSKICLKLFSSTRVLEAALFVFTTLCFVLIFSNSIDQVLITVAFCIMLGGLAWPLCNEFISHSAPQEMRGKILGVSQSVQSCAMALAPAVGGIAYQVFSGFPFLISALASLIAGILYFSLKERE